MALQNKMDELYAEMDATADSHRAQCVKLRDERDALREALDLKDQSVRNAEATSRRASEAQKTNLLRAKRRWNHC